MARNTYSRSASKNARNRRIAMRRKTWRKLLLISLILSLFLVYYVVLPYGYLLFDNRSLRGGELGRMFDTLGRTIMFRRLMRQRTARLKELGIVLPPMKDVINKKGIPNLPQAAVAEILIRNKILIRQLEVADTAALQWNVSCRETSNATVIPRHVLQPDHGDFFRPLYTPGLEVIQFNHYSMRKLIQERFPVLLQKFDRTVDKNEQTLIWSLCALYSFGGYVFGPSYRAVDEILDGFLGFRGGCDPVGFVVFQRATSGNVIPVQVMALASTPKHPRVKRILDMLASQTDAVTASTLLSAFYDNEVEEEKLLHAPIKDQWDIFTCSCSKQSLYKEASCCETVEHSVADKVLLEVEKQPSLVVGNISPRFYVKVVGSKDKYDSVRNPAATAVEVSITESAGTSSPEKVPKDTIRERLLEVNCNAGWLCNRCLKNALYGTHDACKLVCPSCYKHIICDEPDRVPKKQVQIDVSVRETRVLAPGEQRIPRIIHQTWFDEPSVDRYPQLARLQNSWKNQGWEYRFYRDDDIREYITKHYPPRFVDAFDSVVPGAFKADFFRYLVLLKDGGVYADADILLDTNLDAFITPSMAFFGPRDIVGDYAGENFCLWNGMMGAAPGHPFMALAAEALLTNILNRVDYYDMEREMCRVSGTAGEVWKMRALTILSLSGPCLLGSAVNKALGRRNYLSKYLPGWLIPEGSNNTVVDDDVGDALLLIASRADMGALRFSDVDRNLMVASTGMTELSKDPILTMEEASQAVQAESSHVHYSSFEHVNDVFGAQGIYVDNLVTNEIIKLNVGKIV